MVRFGAIAALSLAVFLGPLPAWTQMPSHIQAVQDFLLGWGKGNWERVSATVGVKVGGKEYTIDPEATKADVRLILPFRGLSTIREGGKVTGVAVEAITLTVEGQERTGKATVTVEEQGGKFSVTGISVE
jgi:hypothetical protein